MNNPTDPKEIVLAFVKALNEEDFDAARQYISDDMSFVGVLGTRDGGDVYINDMTKMKLKYGVQKVFVDGNDVCLWYELTMSTVKTPGCGWYHVENGKVKSLKVLFDPRPVLESSGKS